MTNARKKQARKSVARRPRPTRQGNVALQALRSAPPDTSHHEEQLIALVDPFSPNAGQAKYPDQGSGRTLTFQQRYAQTISSTAGGFAAFSINVKPNFPFLMQNGVAGTTVTWATTYTDDQGSNLINTYGETYRPISVGLRILNLLSATNSSGYVVIAKGGAPPLGPGTTQINPNNFASWETHPNGHGDEFHATSHPFNANSYGFGSVAAYKTNTAQDNSWENIYFYASGLPNSASCFFVELFINYEYTTKEDSPIAQLATAQPVMDVNMMTAVNSVQSTLPTSHRATSGGTRAKIKQEAKKALLKHVLPFAVKKATQFLA